MNPKYFILAVWGMAAIVLMTGCSASEEITTVPELTSFSNSECNDITYKFKMTNETQDVPRHSELTPPIISLVYSAGRGKLDLHFENMIFYCNFDPVKFIAKVEENVISIGYFPNYMMGEYIDCVCQVDLDCSLENLSSGKYILDIYDLERLNQEIPDFPDDPKYPKFSKEVDLTKDISISFSY